MKDVGMVQGIIKKKTGDYPWVIFKLQTQKFAFNSQYVESINLLDKEVSPIPNSKPWVKGLMDYRGKIVKIIDLRVKLGIQSVVKEKSDFEAMINKRKEDHVVWVDTLEGSVIHGKKFNLATDPHRCAFGQWYDNFKSDNYRVNYELSKIDEPHKKLHQMAAVVDELKKQYSGDDLIREQKKMIQLLRNTHMHQVLNLIESAKSALLENFRNMVINLEINNQLVGVVVDEIIGVSPLQNIRENDKDNSTWQSKYIRATGEYGKENEMVMVMDFDSLIEDIQE